MLIYYVVGRLGVHLTREASRSALPDAPVIQHRRPWPAEFRIRTAGALHRLADRTAPADTRVARGPLQQI
jgi:hypothetical protein